MSSNVVVRMAEERDVGALAGLRWVWSPPAEPDTPGSRRDYAEWLGNWMTAHRDDVLCAVAVLDGRLVGMAWLAIYERVPNPGARRRRTGDVQSVFVLEEHRGLGIGRHLITLLCAAADELGLPSITVWSSVAAREFYERLGFSSPELLLERRIPATPPQLGTAARDV